MNDSLGELRSQIDALDAELVTVLSKRMKVVRLVSAVKKQLRAEPLDEARWAQVLAGVVNQGKKYGLSPSFIQIIWREIHKEAIRIEKRRKT